ncbi:hypothetical protein Acr_20g0005870 [Actinidia rufa]|uniref:Phorbol-ester/DAG-type domain-containing protein n=1 Tax=Actinidia rufa TaxID=165716 RepID=A0A7J0GDD8_9ERIC|nr:hypothetical protein Acr_20g0005870 [Actinidia rufa]
MEIEHISHKHPLIFNEEHKDNIVEALCNGCQLPISGTPSYKCRQCQYFYLHKACAELPREMKHPMHLQHPLSLLPSPPYPRKECNACRRSCESFTYHCSSCQFNLDVACALLAQKIDLGCHEHPLTPLQRPALFLCDACGTKHEGSSYQCAICQFWINQECAKLPRTIEHGSHEHLLSLSYSLPLEDYRSASYCGICSKKVNRVNWIYNCAECKYHAHVNCATSKRKLSRDHKVSQIDQKSEVTVRELEHNLIRLPLSVKSGNPIPDSVKESIFRGENKNATHIYHISHHHPLHFGDMQINDESCSGNKLLKCHGCAKPIASPFYSCSECNFFLHKRCAKLPFELRHPGHPEHSLILSRWQSEYSNLPSCQGCKMHCNGVLFTCLACNFFLDIECALLQGVIVHEAHKHTLALRKTSNDQCAVCEYRCSGLALVCGCCNFTLHLRCALLPRTVRHQCDEHPLTLTYSAVKDHSDEHYCEICDIQMNSKCWFYHCGDCNQSLETQCIREADAQGSSLFIIKHESHMHMLAIEATLDFQCAGCNNMSSGVALVCGTCNFKLHTGCAFLPSTVRHRYDEHPYTLTYSGDQEEYCCDICEGEINPESWFYHCDDCNQSLHAICIQVDEYSNIKIGDELNVGGHPHLLTYIRHPKNISPCDRCGELVKGSGFQCAPCNFRLHIPCARNAVNERMFSLEQLI